MFSLSKIDVYQGRIVQIDSPVKAVSGLAVAVFCVANATSARPDLENQ
jgi:hypothetical protein